MKKQWGHKLVVLLCIFQVVHLFGFRTMSSLSGFIKLAPFRVARSCTSNRLTHPSRSAIRYATQQAHGRALLNIAEGDRVVLPDGREGTVIKQAVNGWSTVQINGSDSPTKVRTNALKQALSAPAPQPVAAKSVLNILKPPPNHEKTRKWVAFSDLHVHSKSIDTCLQVLDHVHDTEIGRASCRERVL